LFHLIASLK